MSTQWRCHGAVDRPAYPLSAEIEVFAKLGGSTGYQVSKTVQLLSAPSQTPLSPLPLSSGVSSTQKVVGYFGANLNVGEQRHKMYVRNSFTVVNLHDLWSNCPRSIWHIICLLYTSPSPRDGLLSRMPSSA